MHRGTTSPCARCHSISLERFHVRQNNGYKEPSAGSVLPESYEGWTELNLLAMGFRLHEKANQNKFVFCDTKRKTLLDIKLFFSFHIEAIKRSVKFVLIFGQRPE